MAKVYECKLVKDRYLYFPQMGMYWDLCPIKRQAGENEQGLNERIDTTNNALKKLSDAAAGEQVWHPTLFLNSVQMSALPTNWQVTFHPKVWFMYANPSFRGDVKPSVGVWNPVDIVWVSNDKVLVWEFNGSVTNTANWLGHRFRLVKESEIQSDSVPDPDEPNDEPDPEVPQPSGDLYIHMKCPHCGKKIF